MTHVFLSYCHEDKALTTALTDLLMEAGATSHFLDVDLETGISVGRLWERELYRELRRADVVIALVSEAQRNSRWCFAELAIARSIGKTILPICLDDGRPHPILTDTHHISISALESPEGHDRVLAELRRLGASGKHSPFAFDVERAPYPGLEPYSEADAAVFFGRETETREILDTITSIMLSSQSQVLTVTGPSGSGKSSLIRAGVLSRLCRDEERWLVIPRTVPGDNPHFSLAQSLLTFMQTGTSGSSQLARTLRDDRNALRESLIDFSFRKSDANACHFVLFVDQFEELYTLCEEQARAAFIELLRLATVRGSPLFLLLTLRSEFLDRVINDASWICERTKVALPLERERLPAVIEGPARLVGMEFAPGLVERMVADTKGGDALPMLNFTLNQLHKLVGTYVVVGHDDYEALGGVIGALRRQADAVQAALEERGLGRFVEPTLLRLTDVNHQGEPVRRRLRQGGLSRQESEVVSAFVNARLLKTDGDGKDATVEVAHEALLRQWHPLRRAIERTQDRMATLARLYQLADHWEASGGHASYLQTGSALQRLVTLVHDTNPPALVQAYLDASITFATPPFWRRMVALLTDVILASILILFLFVYLQIESLSGIVDGPRFWLVLLLMLMIIRTAGFLYGGSPGMRLTGLSLTSRSGKPPHWRQAILRAVLQLIPFHDRICGTILLSKMAQ